MNFGGIHFFYGLFFLACCMAVTVVYLYIPYLFFVAVEKGVYKINYRNAQNRCFAGQGPLPEEILEKPAHRYFDLKSVKIISTIVFVIFATVYTTQRYTYMGHSSCYHEAKEYWVAGQVVLLPRRVMAMVLHPDNILIAPYTYLQEKLFNLGTAHLPEKDGERYVWENAWFLYQYSRELLRPYRVTSHKYEPEMVHLLDRFWASIKGMATLPIADPVIERRYVTGFVALASYYTLYQGHYTGAFFNSGTRQRQTPYLMERLTLILQWLDRLKQTWNTKGMMPELKSGEYSDVLADHQGTSLFILKVLSFALAGNGHFECSHPLIQRLYAAYTEVMSDNPNRNFYLLYSRSNSRQARMGYRNAVYGVRGDMVCYLLTKVCHKKMPEEKYTLVGRKNPRAKFNLNSDFRRVFKRELDQLKPGTRNKNIGGVIQ